MDNVPTLADYCEIVPQEPSVPKPHCNLDSHYVEYIRTLLKLGKSIKQVAKEANVHYQRVWNIKNGMTYRS